MPFLLAAVLLSGYTVSFGGPAIFKYAPELCGLAVSAYLVVRISRYGFGKIRLVYWIAIGLLALHLLFGLIANQVQVGTVIVGGRMYLRTIPFFLLALTLVPSEAALKRQFIVILGIAMLQLPVALYQRVTYIQKRTAEGFVSTTGDYVMGTLGNSGYLSIFLICFSAIIITLYARKLIGLGVTAATLLVILMPTIINETKATLFLIPFAIVIPLLAAAQKNRFAHGVKAVFILAGFISIFVPIYDQLFMMPRYGYGIIDFFQMEGRMTGYLAKGAEVGTTKPVGRLDGFSVAVDVLGEDPSAIMLGLGMGNVSESSFGPQYQGKYFTVYGEFAKTTYGKLLWEIGVIGIALVLFLLIIVANDARRLYRQQDTYGLLALSWLAILPIMVLSMLYKNLLGAPGIGVCFWYYCAVIAAAPKTTVALSPADNVIRRRRTTHRSAPGAQKA